MKWTHSLVTLIARGDCMYSILVNYKRYYTNDVDCTGFIVSKVVPAKSTDSIVTVHRKTKALPNGKIKVVPVIVSNKLLETYNDYVMVSVLFGEVSSYMGKVKSIKAMIFNYADVIVDYNNTEKTYNFTKPTKNAYNKNSNYKTHNLLLSLGLMAHRTHPTDKNFYEFMEKY